MGELLDEYSWTKENKTITHKEHQVPGLGNFTYWNFTSIPPRKQMHYHINIMEFHCIIKGSRFTQIESGGELKTYNYHGNQVFITFPSEIHGSAAEQDTPCQLYGFQLNFANKDCLLGLNREYSNILYSRLMHIPYRQMEMSESHIKYLRIAFNFFSSLKKEDIATGTQFLLAFLFTLPYLQPVKEIRVDYIDSGILDSIRYFKEHLNERLKINDLAAAAGYSPSYYKIKFRSEIGITPAEYMTIEKIEASKHMLAETSMSITDIAYSLGFPSSNYFSTVFKKYNSMSPREYRRQNNPG